MKKTLLLLALMAAPALAGEGKWTPQQVLELDPAWLKAQGLKLPPERLWDPKRGTGLLAGTVNVGGCSGAFIAESGLVITNHHCVFSIIQEHSTPERDLITQGFLAKRREDELPGKGARIQVPRRFTRNRAVNNGAKRASRSRTASCVKTKPRARNISARSRRLSLYRSRHNTTSRTISVGSSR